MNKDDILIVKYPFLMKNEQATKLYESILKQKENGVIILPDYCEVVFAPKDTKIKTCREGWTCMKPDEQSHEYTNFMGYRPSIYVNDKFIIEFGKFYGYVDLSNLKSIKWLKDHKKIIDENDPENYVFCGGWGPEIKFTADEFRKFWDLYIQDINEYDFSVDGYINYDKPYDPNETWVFYSGFSGTFKEAVYDTDDKKTIIWG